MLHTSTSVQAAVVVAIEFEPCSLLLQLTWEAFYCPGAQAQCAHNPNPTEPIYIAYASTQTINIQTQGNSIKGGGANLNTYRT